MNIMKLVTHCYIDYFEVRDSLTGEFVDNICNDFDCESFAALYSKFSTYPLVDWSITKDCDAIVCTISIPVVEV